MNYIHLLAVLMLVFFPLAYISMKNGFKLAVKGYNKEDMKDYKAAFWLITVAALIIRIICAVKYNLHSDLSCFNYWSEHVYSVGFSKFYETASFADYPPGYMYILWVVGAIKDVFNITTSSSMGAFMIKSPAILFDMATAVIIYMISKKKLNQHAALICFLVYIFNPIVILNSAVWGQVDSVFGLGIFLMCYYIYTNRTKFAYMCFGFSILIKPQAAMFTPILIFAILEEIFIDHDKTEKRIAFKFKFTALKTQGIWCLASIAGTFMLMLPFKIGTVISKYFSTMGSYEYASVNAYNWWSMFGLDWISQEEKAFGLTYKQWGTLMIFTICIVATIIWLSRTWDKTRYFMIAIFICASMFVFSVRMHERYIYPAVIMMLFLFIVNKHKRMFWMYTMFSIAHFYNAAHVLFFYDPSNFDRTKPEIILISLLHVTLYFIMLGYCMKTYFKNKNDESIEFIDTISESSEKVKANNKNTKKKKLNNDKKFYIADTIEKTKQFVKLTKYDWIILGVITVVYAIIAFYNLGDMDAPQSFWETEKQDEGITIELPEGTEIGSINYYLGNYETRQFSVYLSTSEFGVWDNLTTSVETKIDEKGNEYEENVIVAPNKTMDAVFCWSKWDINQKADILYMVSTSDRCVIGELVIKDTDGNVVTPLNADDEKLAGMFDEQDKLPEKFSYRNSTYFDEIYHARTAYEYIQGIYSYENTHPPLGKIFIALGMMIFGVCPFGWRFAGTLFGVIMIPCIYIFAKQLFKKTNIATIACLLLTFDFMHFSQTRIATIDVFVTFFIILMYYFMYKYYMMSFYDSKLWKTFIPLGLSAVCMGLGCACKWTGVYAGLGLGVIFFYTVYLRFKEYMFAKQHKSGETNGIKHADVVAKFKKNLAGTLGFCIVSFIIVAGTIYTLSYIPFVSGYITPNTEDYAIGRVVEDLVTGEDATFERDSLVGRMLANQYTMYSYHSEVEFEHGYASRWYEWPIIIRPIWYYTGVLDGDMREGLSAMGNPLVWWLGIPAFMYVVYLAFKKKDKIALFLMIGYLAQMIPWVPIKRLTFIYHYFPSVPFVVLMLTYSIYLIIQNHPEFTYYKLTKAKTDSKLAIVTAKSNTKYLAYIFVGVTIVLFIMFYPVLSGMPVNGNYVNTWLRWLDTWVFIDF